jgi:hypothetical protein
MKTIAATTSRPPADATDATTQRSPAGLWIAAGVGAGVIVLGLIGWLVVRTGPPVEPRLNEPTPVLAKFVASTAFERMPYEKQRLYYQILDDRGNEIAQAYRDKHLSEAEYRSALDAAWLGKHINRVEKYMAKSPMARSQYIDELLKKTREDAATRPAGS